MIQQLRDRAESFAENVWLRLGGRLAMLSLGVTLPIFGFFGADLYYKIDTGVTNVAVLQTEMGDVSERLRSFSQSLYSSGDAERDFKIRDAKDIEQDKVRDAEETAQNRRLDMVESSVEQLRVGR